MPIIPVPIYQSRPWGGTRLRTRYGRETPPHTGEAWELSVYDHGVSRDASGRALRELYPDLRLLFKLLDTAQMLSVQVHPPRGPEAKTEMWIILDAAPDAVVYAGVRPGVTKEELRRRIAEQTLTEALVRYDVRPGDVFFLPGGTVHAMGAGILAAEIQQPGDRTWRLYDWGRPRELHVEQGLADTELAQQPVTAHIDRDSACQTLPGCAYFTAEYRHDAAIRAGTDGLHTLLFLPEAGTVETADGTVCVPRGTTVFLPADTGGFAILPAEGGSKPEALIFRQPQNG